MSFQARRNGRSGFPQASQSTPIESFKAYTPPTSGDLYLHPKLGKIKLGHRASGTCFWAIPISGLSSNHRFEVNPALLQRHHEPEPIADA